jgi:tripartite-type tricarboxylate transporter receptor subunit TctC
MRAGGTRPGTWARPSRRAVLAAAGATAAMLLSPGGSSAAAPKLPSTIRIYVPFGRGSVVAVVCDVLQGALSSELSRRVEIDFPPLPDRMATSLKNLATARSGELRLLATDTLVHAMYDSAEAARNPKAPPSLDGLVPVATLTIGYSTALFVAADSPVRDFEAFRQMARSRELTIANSNPGSVHKRFLERALDQGLRDVLSPTRERVFQVVIDGGAAGGLINTPSLVAFIRANPGKLRPILTFGGERNADLAVPTLRELTGNHSIATTNSVGLFAPAGTSPEVVELLRAALVAAAAHKDVVTVATSMGLPLQISDAADLAATVERDRRVVRESGL